MTSWSSETPTKSPSLTKQKTEFLLPTSCICVSVLPPLSSCEHGLVQPVFLFKTPSHGDVLHATMGQKFKLYAQAKATEARYIILEKDPVLWTCNWEHVRNLSCFFCLHSWSINDFQVSGPQNMTKEFKAGEQGTAELILSWTPQHSDLYRIVPVCFTAETNQRWMLLST